MGWMRFAAMLVSNSPRVLLAYTAARAHKTRHRKAPHSTSLHFFVLNGSDYAIVLAGVALLMLVTVLGGELGLVFEATVLFCGALLSYVAIILIEDNIRHDVILAILILLYLCCDQGERRGSIMYTLACPVITFMFTNTGLRRSGLLTIWLISEAIRLTTAAAANDYRSLIVSLSSDLLGLAFGICLYFNIYYVGTEILRYRNRPRLALQDLPALQPLELTTFRALRPFVPNGLPEFTHQDHVAVLLQMPQISSAREQVLAQLGAPPGESRAPRAPGAAKSGVFTEPRRAPAEHTPAVPKRRSRRQKTVTFGAQTASAADVARREMERVGYSDVESVAESQDPESVEKRKELKVRRRNRRERSLAIRAYASAFLINKQDEQQQDSAVRSSGGMGSRHSALRMNEAEAPLNEPVRGLWCFRRIHPRDPIMAGAIPLFVGHHRTPLQRLLPFLLDAATEAVIQEAAWKAKPPELRMSWSGRFADVKVERWFIVWRRSAVTRWFFVTVRWQIIQQIVALIVIAGCTCGWGRFDFGADEFPKVLFWLMWLARLVLHSVVATLFFWERFHEKSKSWLEWTDISTRHSVMCRLFVLWLIVASTIDWWLLSMIPDPQSDVWSMRAYALLSQVPNFPFLLAGSQALNFTVLAAMCFYFIVIQRLLPNRQDFTMYQLIPLAACSIMQHYFVARPLDQNYRRMFVAYALPYLLYLDSFRPRHTIAGAFEGVDDDASVVVDDCTSYDSSFALSEWA